jgi:hypothetical protein
MNKKLFHIYVRHFILFTDPSIAPGARSEIQECAISIGLLMFGIILEKLINLIRETLGPNALNKPTVIPINSPLITLGGEKLTTSSHNDTKHSNKSKPAKCDDKINERYVYMLLILMGTL